MGKIVFNQIFLYFLVDEFEPPTGADPGFDEGGFG